MLSRRTVNPHARLSSAATSRSPSGAGAVPRTAAAKSARASWLPVGSARRRRSAESAVPAAPAARRRMASIVPTKRAVGLVLEPYLQSTSRRERSPRVPPRRPRLLIVQLPGATGARTASGLNASARGRGLGQRAASASVNSMLRRGDEPLVEALCRRFEKSAGARGRACRGTTLMPRATAAAMASSAPRSAGVDGQDSGAAMPTPRGGQRLLATASGPGLSTRATRRSCRTGGSRACSRST